MSTELVQVHVFWQPDWANPSDREERTVAWREGLTVADLLWDEIREEPGLVAVTDGKRVPEPWDEQELRPGAYVTLARWPGDPVSILIDVALAVAVAIASNAILKAIYGDLKQTVEQEDASSQTYSWSGIQTAYRAQGLVIPYWAGDMRGGGVVVQRSLQVVQSEGKPRSILYLLIALGSGPFTEIAGYTSDQDFLTADLLTGVRLNGNPAENYEGITAFIRMGTLEQDPIPGFDRIEVLHAVDLPITNDDPATTDWSNAATFDLPAAAAGALLTLEFPNGLYSLNTQSGALQAKQVEFDVRYRTIDSSGNTTSDWLEDPNNPFPVSAALQGRFQHQINVQFETPGSFTPPTGGKSMQLGGTTSHVKANFASLTRSDGLSFWTLGNTPAELSLAFWTLPGDASFSLGLSWVGWLEGVDDGVNITDRGFGIRTQLVAPSVYAIVGQGGNGFGDVEVGLGQSGQLAQVPQDQWAHAVLTYKANTPQAGQHRYRLYVNGALVQERISSANVQIPTGGTTRLRFGINDKNLFVGQWEQARYDDAGMWDREITGAEVAQLWNSGSGQAIDASSPQLMALWKFDDDLLDSSANSNTLVADGTAETYLSGVLGGSFNPGSNEALYRIEIQRRSTPSESTTEADEVRWENVIGLRFDQLAYPEIALLGLHIDATDQLSGGQPVVEIDAKGPAPLRYDESTDAWLQDASAMGKPAWHFAAFMTDRLNGLGQYFEPSDLHGASFLAWQARNEELLDDQRGRIDVASFAAITHESQETLEIRFDSQPPLHWVVGKRLRLLELANTTGATVTQASLMSNLSSTVVQPALLEPIYEDGTTGEWVALFLWSETGGVSFSQMVTDGAYEPNSEATVRLGGLEERHRLALILDGRGAKGWDAALLMARASRAVPMRVGRQLRIKHSAPKTPVQLFNADRIEEFSLRLTRRPASQRFNRAIAEILDEDSNYARTPVPQDHPDLESDPTGDVQISERNFELRGVTRRSEAKRELVYLLNASKLLRLVAEFSVHHDGVTAETGDVVIVEHPEYSNGLGGSIEVASPDENSIVIDRPITLKASTTYQVVVSSSQDNSWAYATVTAAAGDYARGDSITCNDLSFVEGAAKYTPQVGDLWVIGQLTYAQRQFEIVSLVTDPKSGRRNIKAVEYNGDAFAEGTFPEAPSDPGVEVSAPGLDGQAEPVLALFSAVDSTALGPNGELVGAISVQWQADKDSVFSAAMVQVLVREFSDSDQAWRVLGVAPIEASVATFESTWLRPGQSYEVMARVVGANGLRGSLRTAPRAIINFDGLVARPAAPGGVAALAQGRKAVYRLTGDRNGTAISLRRGRGWFLADQIAVVSGDSQEAFPTDDFVLTPNTQPTLRARYIYGTGMVSAEATVVPSLSGSMDLEAAAFSVDVAEQTDDWETGSDYSLTDLEVVVEDGADILQFPSSVTGAATGIYISQVFDATDEDDYHLSVVMEGVQIHPLPFESWPKSARTRRGDNWDMVEGPLDPSDPYYLRVERKVEVRFSSTDDPTSASWQEYRPGRYRFRSCQVRLTLTRPAGFEGYDANVEISRLAVQANAFSPRRIDGGTF